MKTTLILFIFSITTSVYSYTISGIVTDQNNTPLPYANIIISGTLDGTATNENGEFYLKTDLESIKLQFSYTGYYTQTKTIRSASGEKLIIKLTPQAISIKEIIVKPGMEDPAYPIIRKAIKKRKYYQNQVKAYTCTAYTKSTVRLDKLPNKIMGKKVFKDSTEKKEALGLQYLSESESELFYSAPNTLQEKMISSRVSGDTQGFSFNYISFFLLNYYKNRVELPVDASGRGFVSPISRGATFYYRYQLEGTFVEDGKHINKIRVIPKRYIHPVFNGFIYIEDDTWRIHSVDLKVMPQVKVQYMDTIHIKQSYIKIIEDVYLPFSQSTGFNFNISMMGASIKGKGIFHSHFTNYKTDRESEPTFLFNKNQRIVVDENANKRDSSYFAANRPIPLTNEELKNYKMKDSIEVVHNSKEYKDSINRDINKFNYTDILTSYNYKIDDKNNIGYLGPLFSTNFNTVQGYNSNISIYYNKELPKRRDFRLSSTYNYSYNTKDVHLKIYTK